MSYHANMKDTICEQLIQDIMHGVYHSDQILTEKMLAEKYGCSKAPVREALRELCAHRILRSIPRYGYEFLQISPVEVREILQYRILLEGGLMKLNYQQITREQLGQLETCKEHYDLTVGTLWDNWKANTDFHLLLIDCWGNHYATAELSQALDRLQIAYAFSRIENWDGTPPTNDRWEHDAIIDALREQDIDRALAALTMDLSYFRELCNE